jgi:hypothetical protein
MKGKLYYGPRYNKGDYVLHIESKKKGTIVDLDRIMPFNLYNCTVKFEDGSQATELESSFRRLRKAT